MAKKVVLTLDQGTDTEVSVSISDREGTALDIASARMQLRTKIEAEDIADELTTENNRILLEEGGVRLVFPNAKTTEIKAGTYVYDLEVVDSLGMVTRVMEGTVTIRPEVTR